MKNRTLLFSAAPVLALGAVLATVQAGQDPREAGAPRSATDEILENWPDASRKAARATIDQYGAPQGVTPTMLIWNANGPWTQTIVWRDPVRHNFPVPHEDVLEQTIGYRVPAEYFDDLAHFDGSIICERTKGVTSARCDKEAMNFLALNIAHDIVEGKIDVDDARERYAELVKRFQNDDKDPYTQKLNFRPQPNLGDPDEALLREKK